MDPLAAQPFDDLLAELADPYPVAGKLGVCPGKADDIAVRRVRLGAEQEIRGGEVEEAEGVRLDDLRQVEHLAQVDPGGWRHDGEDLVACLRRCDQVADRADSVDARHDGGHLVDRAALDDAFEAPELRDMELGVDHLALVVELNRDFRVALDPGDRVDDGCAAHGGSSTAEAGVVAVEGVPLERVHEAMVDEICQRRTARWEDVDGGVAMHRHGHRQECGYTLVSAIRR